MAQLITTVQETFQKFETILSKQSEQISNLISLMTKVISKL